MASGARRLHDGDGDLVDRIHTLARWPAGLDPTAIPDAAKSRAALIVADDIGAMAAGTVVGEVAALHRLVSTRPGEPEAHLAGTDLPPLRREEAAFANAVAANWCELDEGYRPIACHAGLYTVPAVLAEAEATGASAALVLEAVIVGYEMATRLARCFAGPELIVHPHAGLSAIAATAALAHMRGLSADDRVAAMGAAATLSAPGPWSHAMGGLQIRNAWAGHGATTAFRTLTAVEAGMAGDAAGVVEVLSDVMGARDRQSVDPAALVDDLGTHWAVTDGYHKIYACCQYAHAGIHAALEIRAGMTDDDWLAEIEAIEVATHPLALMLADAEPATDLAARFSLPHAIAVALLTGRADAASFAADRVSNPLIARLRRLVRLSEFQPLPAPPMDRPARVTVVLCGNRRLSAQCDSAPGSPDCPLNRDAVLAKTRAAIDGRNPALVAWTAALATLEPDTLTARVPPLASPANYPTSHPALRPAG